MEMTQMERLQSALDDATKKLAKLPKIPRKRLPGGSIVDAFVPVMYYRPDGTVDAVLVTAEDFIKGKM